MWLMCCWWTALVQKADQTPAVLSGLPATVSVNKIALEHSPAPLVCVLPTAIFKGGQQH